MIETSGLPFPEGSPEPGACVRIERPEEGLAVLVLDPPHRKLAVLDLPLMRDLDAALDELAGERGLRGLVITGREPISFAAGADVDALGAIQDAAQGELLARMGQDVFERIGSLRGVRSVAAVGGPVPGGAYELCLACDAIVAAEHPKTRLGLPETQLGILPGWGGTQRLPRRVGVPVALDLILAGKLLPVRPARRRGLVDRVTSPEYLLRVAADLALGREPIRRPRRGLARWLVDRNPVAARLIGRQAGAKLQAKTRGHYPAPERALGLILDAPRSALRKGLADEARALGELAASSTCKSLVTVFQSMEAAKKLGRDTLGAREVRRVGVVGAGVMGGAVAGLAAEKGFGARLRDVSLAVLTSAVHEHRRRVRRNLSRRRLQVFEANAAIDRLETTVEPAGFARCDLAIEAVAERLDVKRLVMRELAEQMPGDAILATNTSSLSVDAIAQGLPNPERVVGMHFFNPVHRMPLVEVVRGSATSDATVAATARLALDLGKTPVVVGDVAGFLVNRLLGPYLDEAARLFEAGVEPERIERLAVEFGMPMGPLELLDEVGLDIAAHAASSLYEAYGERMTPSGVLNGMLAEKRLGRKSGRGFYVHEAQRGGRGKKRLADDLQRFVSRERSRGQDFSDAAVLDGLLLAMVNEAARCLEEGVVASARELDLATVMGMGFPPFQGGLMRWADTIGASDLVARLSSLAGTPEVVSRPGGSAKYRPAQSLVEMVRTGGSFHAAPAAD